MNFSSRSQPQAGVYIIFPCIFREFPAKSRAKFEDCDRFILPNLYLACHFSPVTSYDGNSLIAALLLSERGKNDLPERFGVLMMHSEAKITTCDGLASNGSTISGSIAETLSKFDLNSELLKYCSGGLRYGIDHERVLVPANCESI